MTNANQNKIKKEKINLNIINKQIHGPRVNNFVLYTHNNTDPEAGGDYYDSKAEKDPQYREVSQHTYNSPTNIRRIFITHKNIHIHYYTPFIKKGNKQTYNYVSRSLKSNIGKSFLDIAKEHIMEEETISKYIASLQCGANVPAPTRYEFVSDGFNFLSYPFVCANIEEVYFDWLILLAPSMASMFGNYASKKALIAYINNSHREIKKDTFLPTSCLAAKSLNPTNIGEVLKKFPRLKCIGFISNLENIVDPSIGTESIFSSLSNLDKSWLVTNMKLVKNQGGCVLIDDLKDKHKDPYDKTFFITRPYYKFDTEELAPKTSSIKARLDKERLEKNFGNKYKNKEETSEEIKSEEDEDTKGLLEQTLESKFNGLYEDSKTESLKAVLNVLKDCYSKDDRKAVLKTVSKDNRNRYSKYLGIEA